MKEPPIISWGAYVESNVNYGAFEAYSMSHALCVVSQIDWLGAYVVIAPLNKNSDLSKHYSISARLSSPFRHLYTTRRAVL